MYATILPESRIRSMHMRQAFARLAETLVLVALATYLFQLANSGESWTWLKLTYAYSTAFCAIGIFSGARSNWRYARNGGLR